MDGRKLWNQPSILKIERCSAGRYYDEAAGLCRSCGNGFYQPEEGKFRCLPCSFGLTTRTAEATSSQECRGMESRYIRSF